MPRRSVFDQGRLLRALGAQHQVISRSQALACGIPRSTITSWCRPEGIWQRLLPGVYLTVTGKPTSEQRLMAALLYAGPHSMITGPAALRAYRLRSPGPDVIDVLVPQAARRQSTGFVRVHRSRRLPRAYRIGPIRYAVPARAVADAARLLPSLDDVRATDGTDIGEVDAWWAVEGVSMEIDSQEYHFYRADWLRTEAKRSRLLKHGIFPHNIAPVRVERDWDSICAEIRSSLDKGRQRPRLPIVAFAPAA
jgi:hypothetical protein